MHGFLLALAIAAIGAIVVYRLLMNLRRHQQAAYIRGFAWPRGLLDMLEAAHSDFTRKETALIGQGLRQFFLAYLMSGGKFVAMPSRAADELWHEFILYTRDYRDFCAQAFGGFLHHTPAIVLAEGAKRDNEGLRRVWWHACKDENIDTRRPTRLPLLFARDAKLKIPGGFVYQPDCRALREGGAAGGQCGGDFSSASYDGGTSGFGDSGGDGGSGHGGGHGGGDAGSGGDGGGGDGGGGCGGGCGGGD